MAQVNQELLQRFQRASVAVSSAASGAPVHSAVLQDEEQSRKLQEIVDLLVAAGYFRARIKGLSPFDKVVGGLSWCLEALSVDLDVDLLFQENATIGQQIALSEKIVAVLPRVQCPHRIEPHQVQGLDLEHVFPVVQWLVKASMEAREQNCAQMRNYALLQFRKEVPEWGAQPPHLHMLERLHRIVDDVPCRAELAQYQHRFLDLYDQVAAKHKETKQYYSLYNSLEDQRRYMRKELGLLNSVADNYPRAMETASGREEFLQQLHGIVDGLKLNRLKLEQQVQAQRALRDHLAEALQQLLEHQRGYVAAVNELSELGRSYTALLQLRE
uniref:Coiled-coil domain-containing protein 93 n=1 Tax=Dendroctonus ponderosae TaxID=77166 RepID=A0AAR5Q5A4_DENPD